MVIPFNPWLVTLAGTVLVVGGNKLLKCEAEWKKVCGEWLFVCGICLWSLAGVLFSGTQFVWK